MTATENKCGHQSNELNDCRKWIQKKNTQWKAMKVCHNINFCCLTVIVFVCVASAILLSLRFFFSLYLFICRSSQTNCDKYNFVAFGRTTFCIFNFQGPLFWQWSTRSGTFELKTDKNRNCKIEKTTNRLSAHMNRSISLPTTNNKQQQSKRPDDACASTKSKHQPCVLRSFQPIYHISLALPVNDIV